MSLRIKAKEIITISDNSIPPDKLFLKLINDQWWVEFDTKTPLTRNKLRLWKKTFPIFKTFLLSKDYHELLGGCSTPSRVKWATMFGFQKIKEITVDDKVWFIVSMCF